MKKRAAFGLVILTLVACALQPPATPPPLPPDITPTAIPTFPPASATVSIVTSTVETLPPQPTATHTSAPAVVSTATSLPPPITESYNPYAVILVSSNDVLNIRSSAGAGNPIVGELQPTALGVNRVGPSSSVGESRWVEIQNPGGGTGWVNANFLTEAITSSAFCSDTRATDLLNRLKTTMLNSDGDLFASLLSPVHGLDLRLWRYGTVVNYSPEEASWTFDSDYVVSWGPAPGSGEETRGTFRTQPLPKLLEVFGSNYSLHCNDALDLATFTLVPWPPDYTNINFYTLYKPGTDQYGGLDWRAWIAGIEYVQGQPTLFALIHFQWEP
jgi:hypothetical protein